MMDLKSRQEAERATTHVYFVSAVIQQSNQTKNSICDFFFIEPVDFFVEMYAYSNVLHTYFMVAKSCDEDLAGICEDLAEEFWAIVDRNQNQPDYAEFPEVDEFELDVVRRLGV